MKAGEKKCPSCAEAVKVDARVCRHCGYQFSEEELAAEKAKQAQATKIGCGVMLVIGLGLLGYCTFASGETAEQKAARETKSAEERRTGMHCLSSWDGSHGGFVDAVKSTLRDPDSFEHAETRITPADAKGEHMVVMQYRAANGFGGKNVLTAMGVVKQADCGVRVTSSGLEEGR